MLRGGVRGGGNLARAFSVIGAVRAHVHALPHTQYIHSYTHARTHAHAHAHAHMQTSIRPSLLPPLRLQRRGGGAPPSTPKPKPKPKSTPNPNPTPTPTPTPTSTSTPWGRAKEPPPLCPPSLPRSRWATAVPARRPQRLRRFSTASAPKTSAGARRIPRPSRLC